MGAIRLGVSLVFQRESWGRFDGFGGVLAMSLDNRGCGSKLG